MKRAFFLVGLAFFFFSGVSMADMGGASEPTVPVQAFEQADSGDNSSTSTSAPASQPKPAHEEAPSSKKAASPASTSKESAVAHAPSDSALAPQPSSPPGNLSQEAAQVLQAELTQLNQNNIQFQQQTDERLLELSAKNEELQGQLRQLNQALALLNQELQQIKQMNGIATPPASQAAAAPATVKSWIPHWVRKLERHLGPVGFSITVVLVLLIMGLLVWAFLPKQDDSLELPVSKTVSEEQDTEDEYDYMGSAESIPAKINLARTYLAMEEFESAKKVLNEVIKIGNSSQQQEANDVLKAIPAGS